MRRPTAASASAWTRASRAAAAYANAKLGELRSARSTIAAPTGRLFRFLARVPVIPAIAIPAHLVVAALVLGGMGCLLFAHYH